MKHTFSKRIITMVIMVACVVGMAVGANAYTMSVGTSINYPKYCSTTQNTNGNRTGFQTTISGAAFTNMPSGYWPYQGHILLRMYTSKSSSAYATTAASHNANGTTASAQFTPSTGNGTYYLGGYTDKGIGATMAVTRSWT